MSADPFGTASVRDRVLAAWAASPARFREDANAEEDLALGGYRDRVVVELAQNASDAAGRARVPGRLLLRLHDGVLTAANTGAPLDAAGVESLSTLRASAKRDDRDDETVGRFGVGFAAVLAMTDEPRIASTTGAVRWSLTDARADVLAVPTLADELARRGGHVPLLRLPYDDAGKPEPGFDTTVVLPLRHAAASALARRLLAEVGDALLLALPGLAEVAVEVDGERTVLAGDDRWQVVRRAGRTELALLADRPVEERGLTQWSVLWARPLAGQPVPATLHAPTPTDESLDLPCLLIASFPLDPSRRHVASGGLTDFLVAEAATAYAELAADSEEPLSLVPGPAPSGALDAALRRSIVDAMSAAPLLVTSGGGRLRPRDAVSVVGVDEYDELLTVLAEVLPGVVPDHRSLDRLGATRLSLADVVDQLAELRRKPAWWRGLYAALTSRVAVGERDALGSLPVPLADGRLVRGPRGLLLFGDALPPGLDALGLRIVHPDAANDVLLRLGAVVATPRTVLADPAVGAAVDNAADAPDPVSLATAVLGLVEAAEVAPGELPWLAGLPLPDEDGELVPAGDLVLPGSVMAAVIEDGSLGRPSADLVDRWDEQVLAAVGVVAGLTVLTDAEVTLDEEAEHDLPDEADWVDDVLAELPRQELPPVLSELRAVRDLDLVRADAWPQVLALLAGDPALRAAVTEPARVVLADGRRVDVPSYTAWWLRRHARLDGRTPGSCMAAGSADLEGLYDVVDSDLDPAFLTAIGVRTTLAALLAEPDGPDELLDRLADSDREVAPDQLRSLYVALAAVDPDRVSPPEQVRVDPMTVVGAEQAVVVDNPAHLQLSWTPAPLVVSLSAAAGLADVLELPTSTARLSGTTATAGSSRSVPTEVGLVLGGAPDSWREHDQLTVDGHDIDWWVNPDGEVHAATMDGLARGLAWSAGRWDLRRDVAAVLADPGRVDDVLAERELES
ncbi:MAG: hypothetical protein ABJA93_00245 [Sporichthyaceae bacterium]